MIVIRTECPTCGEISLEVENIRLHPNSGSTAVYFSYECPRCGSVRGGEAEKRFVEFLISHGTTSEDERFAPEILEYHGGPAIGYDDILDLHVLLDSPAWEQDLVESFHSGDKGDRR